MVDAEIFLEDGAEFLICITLCGISSLLCSANLILFTLLLVHLILHMSPPHSPHLRSHNLSLPRPFTPGLKHLFHKSFPVQSFWFLPDCLHGSLNMNMSTGLSWRWRLFALVSSFYIFLLLVTCYSFSVNVKLFYRIVFLKIHLTATRTRHAVYVCAVV